MPDVTGKIPAFFVGDTGIGLEMRDDVMTPAMKGQAGALSPELQIKYTVPSEKKICRRSCPIYSLGAVPGKELVPSAPAVLGSIRGSLRREDGRGGG